MATLVVPAVVKKPAKGSTANGHAEHGHHELSFVQKYIFSQDHKIIGIQFLFSSTFFLLVGGTLAMIVRLQLGWPGHSFSFLNILPSTMVAGGIILPEFYNSAFTMHATFMIFFAVMPFLMGTFANYLIPLKIGAGDMAFPKINMLSFWFALTAGVVMLSSFFVQGGAAGGGWTAYPPLSDVAELSGVMKGQNLWLISLLISGVSSLMGAVNYITTIVNMRCPGMSFFRLPLTIWAIFVTAILLLLAIPVLTAALVLLLFDRTIHTSFFIPASLMVAGQPITGRTGGGQVLLWQHLFWFFGHPEVYIMILPAMGISSDIISNFARKPVFGYKAMVFSIIGIAVLGFFVWGHHMFQSGMNPLLGTTFMISTMLIAVPSAIKTFNWLGTLWGGNFKFQTPFLFAVGFVSMFVIGGLSGIFMASTPVDIFIHDTYFIVGHIHYVLFGGSVMSIFAGIYFWYPKMFGRMLNETLGKIHFWIVLITFNGVFFPMHILGIGGMMRRIYDYTQYAHLSHFQGLNEFMSINALILGFSTFILLFNMIWSYFKGKPAGMNPWESNTLEWTVPSPPGHGNFAETPHVFRGPYEYSAPGRVSDFWPQNEPPEGWLERAEAMKASPSHA
ncbi:MAG: cbb3-type cytochrome c oxidase subunit I [Candidatus Kapaibacterium sp.]|jgi:cytochrome c oxidase subunit 1